jgi:hypothetical protein
MSIEEDAKATLHHAIQGILDDGEIAIAWVLTVDVAGPEDVRYLAHRAGGGGDGHDNPMAWTALGMLRASVGVAERQLADQTEDDPEDADEEDDES